MLKIKQIIKKFLPVILSLFLTIIYHLYFYFFIPLQLHLDWKQTLILILLSWIFLTVIISYLKLWEKREILWKMLIPTVISGSITGYLLLSLLFYFNEPLWLYYFILCFLFFIVIMFIVFEKIYWFLFNHFSKLVPSCVRKNRLGMLFVKILIPSISTVPFFLYLLIFEWPKAEFFQGILLIFPMIIVSHQYTDLLIKDLKNKNWKQILIKIIIPIIIFSSWQIINVFFNNSIFIDFESSTQFEKAIIYYSVFMLSIFAYFVFYYFKKGLYIFAKWLYELQYKK